MVNRLHPRSAKADNPEIAILYVTLHSEGGTTAAISINTRDLNKLNFDRFVRFPRRLGSSQ